MNKLKAIQWNCRSLKNKWNEFTYFMSANSIDVGIVQETWFNAHDNLTHNNFNIYRLDRFDGYGGVAFIIHKSIRCQIIKEINSNTLQILAVNIQIPNCQVQLKIYNVYCPDKKIDRKIWSECLFTQDMDKTIICGDFNAHHRSWNCQNNNSKGNEIYYLYNNTSFILANNGQYTTIPSMYQSQSVIDLTFISADLYASLNKWTVQSDPMGSNHYPILFELNYNYTQNVLNGQYLNTKCLKKCNWEIYKNTIQNSLQLLQHTSMEDELNSLQDIILNAVEKAIPSKISPNPTNKNGFTPKSWWNEECSRAVAERRLAFKKFRLSMSVINYENYQRAQVKTKEVIQAAKKENWVKLCSKFGEKNSITYAWRIIKKLKNNLITNNEDIIQLDYNLSNEFMDHITPDYVPNESEINLLLTTHTQSEHFLEIDFNIKELKLALSSKKKDTAPGIDQITYSMLKHLPVEAQETLLKIYNNIWNNKLAMPEKWKEFRIIAILKPNKDKKVGSSYRAISLIPCLIKIMNTMIKNRMEWFINKYKLIPDTQIGFRANRGCPDYLITLMTDILTANTNNETTTAVALDVSNAFDKVYIPTLISKMKNFGIPHKFIGHCHKWLTNRSINFFTVNNKITRHSYRGLPQGSVLSPLLFSIYIAELNQYLPENVMSLQYADDMTIYASHKQINFIYRTIQSGLNSLVQELRRIHLDINITKTRVIHFSRKRDINNIQIPLKLDNEIIPTVQEMRILGLIIDNKLNFKKHIDKIYEQTTKDLSILKMIACGRRGAQPDVVINMYKSLIRSKIEYCSSIFGHISKNSLQKLTNVQNQAMRICIGAFKTSPIIAMQSECGLLPLSTRRQISTETLINKIMNDPTHPAHYKLMYLELLCNTHKYWNKKQTPLFIDSMTTVNIANPYHIDKHVIQIKHWDLNKPIQLYDHNITFHSEIGHIKVNKQHISESIIKQLFRQLVNITYKDYITVYTDGSKTTTGVGSAVIIPSLNVFHKYRLGTLCSSYSAEVYAIYKAIEYIRTLSNIDKKIVICTDSLSAIKSIESSIEDGKGENMILNIIKWMLDDKLQLVFQWIPSHCNINNNELVDQLAKEAAQDDRYQIDMYTPAYDFKSARIRHYLNKYREHMLQNNKAKWYKDINDNFTLIPWFKQMNMNREEIINICRMRIGHANVNSRLHYIKMYFTPICLNCTQGKIETIEHVILECPKYTIEREIFLKSIKNTHMNNTSKNTLIQILKCKDFKIYKEINSFLNAIKRTF